MNVPISVDERTQRDPYVFGSLSFLVVVGVLFAQFDAAAAYIVVPGIVGPILQSCGLCCGILGCQLLTQRSRDQRISFAAIAAIETFLGGMMGGLSLHTALASDLLKAEVALVTMAVVSVLSWLIGRRVDSVRWIWRGLIGLALIAIAIVVPPLIEVRFLRDLL